MQTRYLDENGEPLSQEVYLYGEGVNVPQVPAEVVMRRVELLDEHLTELYEPDMLLRNGKRINDVIKAKNFWLKINVLEELR